MHVAVVLDVRPGEEIRRNSPTAERKVRDPQRRGRAHAKVDHLVALLGGAVNHHRTNPADAAHPWLEHTERERSGDRSVDGIAAAIENRYAHFGGTAVLGGDDAAAALHRRLGDELRRAEVVHRKESSRLDATRRISERCRFGAAAMYGARDYLRR